MAKKRLSSLNSDYRYLGLLEHYSHDWELAMYVFFGKYPDHQQRLMLKSIFQENARTSVASGHGTGKSDLISMIIIMFMIFNPKCRVVVVAAKLQVVKDSVWSNLNANFEALEKRMPWVAHYFKITDVNFYEKSQKNVWRASAKGYRINNEQTLAGEHRDVMLTVMEEASVITDAAFQTILGAQTSRDNRVVALSQPTHSGGFFYETQHSRSKLEGGMWDAMTLRSDESEWVQPNFILNCLSDYGGYDSPEFQIKVLGRFPAKQSLFLLGRTEVLGAVGCDVELGDDWGWVATIDVGITRDKSVINISKVSGDIGPDRVVKNVMLMEMAADYGTQAFARRVIAECCSGRFPNITIAIDADGPGHPIWEHIVELVEDGGYDDVTVLAIRWGKPPFTKKQKDRFKNLRAMAHVFAADAIRAKRMSIDSQTKTVEQFCKLPGGLNGSGQWIMMSKQDMKLKMQIASPDRSDTYCFTQIINYKAASIETSFFSSDDADDYNEWLGLDADEKEYEPADGDWDKINHSDDDDHDESYWDDIEEGDIAINEQARKELELLNYTD
ncbi:terminase (plasmid) [Moritella sp. 24]|uniref:terminase n=1 Tax=Moritella sp. 24 TaxID=2746230 RepID=UPI001BA56DEB|nr:terminase [Moritella sp. 24]QUM78768.1 terminase [Moritella sp. 24]